MGKNPMTPECSLRELCFDLTAGLVDRSQFEAQVKDKLRGWMRCDEVRIRCSSEEVDALLAKLSHGSGWAIEASYDQRLFAAMAHNGKLIGVVTCERPAGAEAWTAVDGLQLRRLATILTNHSGCGAHGVHSVFEQEEGVSP